MQVLLWCTRWVPSSASSSEATRCVWCSGFHPLPQLRLTVSNPWCSLLWLLELSPYSSCACFDSYCHCLKSCKCFSLLLWEVGIVQREVLSVSKAALWDWLAKLVRLFKLFPSGCGALWRSLLLCCKGVQCIKAHVPAVCADSTCLKQPGSQGLPAWGPSIIYHFCYRSQLLLWESDLTSWGRDLSRGWTRKEKVTRGLLRASLFILEPSYWHGCNFSLPTSDTAAEWLLEWLVTKWSGASWG